jgi:hypothetical protein
MALAIFFTFLSTVVYAQGRNEQREINVVQATHDERIKLQLGYRGNYLARKPDDLGGMTISRGKYFINEDSIFLFQIPMMDPKPSKWRVIETSENECDSTRSFFIDLDIFSEDSSLQIGSHVFLKNKDDLVATYYQRSGNGVRIYSEGNHLTHLEIGFLFKKTVTIDLHNLWCKESRIDVFLVDDKIRYSGQFDIDTVIKRNGIFIIE